MRSLLIVALLLGGSLLWAQPKYEPLTDSEIVAYLSKATQEQLISDIRSLDRIEHEKPAVTIPGATIGVTGTDAFLSWDDPGVLVLAVDEGRISYEIELPKVRGTHLIRDQTMDVFLVGGACFTAGILLKVAIDFVAYVAK